MKLQDLATLSIALGLGGAVGAIAALVATGGRVFTAFEAFRKQFNDSLAGRNDPASTQLRQAFEDLERDLAQLQSAFSAVMRALRRR